MAVNRNREQLRQAAQFIKQGDHKSAQAIFRELIKADPRDAELWYLYSFATTEKDHQVKSLEKTLSLAADHAKAKERLAQLRGEAPISPRPAPKLSTPPYALMAVGGLASLVIVVLIVTVLSRSQQSIEVLASVTQPPSATFNIVTRKPTNESDVTETPTAVAVANNPTFVPTSTRRPTSTPIVPTDTPTVPYVPQIISTPGEMANVSLEELTEFGGGTGRILYTNGLHSPRFKIYDLHDGSSNTLNLPDQIGNAWWMSDGRQLLVSADWDNNGPCHPDPDQQTPPQDCVGFMDVASGTLRMIDGIPLYSYLDVSPDRSQITYIGADEQVWVVNVDGTQPRVLTKHSDMHTLSRPIWSPDGRFIAYTYRQGDLSEIYIVALDGSEDRMFIHDGWTQGWMPDGSGLLYAGGLPGARSDSVHLFLANADGTQARQLTPFNAYDSVTGFSVSPDGKLVAFSAIDGVYVMSMDGSWVTKLFDERQTFSNLSWEPLPISADATATPTPTITPTLPTSTPLSADDLGGGTGRLLYTDEYYDPRFNVIDLRDGSVSALDVPNLPWQIERAEWVSDGRQLLVSKINEGPDADGCEIEPERLATPLPCVGFIDATSGAMWMIDGVPDNGSIALSPDRSMIAYVGLDQQLWVAKVDGSQARSLTNYTEEDLFVSGPRWTPDSRFISFAYGNGDHYDAHMIALDGSDDHMLIPNGWIIGWTPDGRSMLYTDKASIAINAEDLIFIANADGTDARQLTPTGKYESLHSAALSPNGQLVAFVASNGIYVMNIASGETTQLVDTSSVSLTYYDLSWEPLPVAAGATATPTATITPTLIPPTPLSASEVGGGTGRILYPYQFNFEAKFGMIDLRDGSVSDLVLPQGIISAQWAADGLQLIVSREQSERCAGINTQFVTATPEPCLGFTTFSTGLTVMIQNLGLTTAADLSPDLRQIVYVGLDADGGQEIWIANIDGTNPRQITDEKDYWPNGPVWSPDGHQIAYTRTNPVTYDEEIHIVDADGTDDTVITGGKMPSWSPDGTSLIFTSDRRGSGAIWAIDVSGKNAHHIFAGDGTSGLSWPVWSPDGQLIVFVYKRGLYVMRADGTDAHRVADITDENGSIGKPSWQPLPSTAFSTPTPTPTASPTIPTATPLSIDDAGGGTGEILFYEVGTSQNPGGYHIFNLRDESLTNLPALDNTVSYLDVRWAADGNHLLVIQGHTANSCADLSNSSQGVYVTCVGLLDLQTETVFTLPIDRSVEEIELSPEGSILAFIDKDLNDLPQVWVIQVSSGEARQLTNIPRGVTSGELRWTPDGRFITYSFWNGSQQDVHLVSSDGTEDRLLIQNAGQPAWSSDGILAYASEGNIYTVNMDGTNRRKLTYAAYDGYPVWSPDGQFIVYLRGKDKLYLMRADGSGQRMIIQAYPGNEFLDPSWRPLLVSAPVATYTPMPTLTPKSPMIIPTAALASGSTVGGGTGRILYIDTTNSGGLKTIDLNTLAISGIELSESMRTPWWFADGRHYVVQALAENGSCDPTVQIAYTGVPKWCLTAVNADTLETHLLTNAAIAEPFALSPDMTLIAYIDYDRASLAQVFVMDVDGTNPRQITHYTQVDFGNPSELGWSPDGRFIVYAETVSNTHPAQIVRISVTGSDKTMLIEDGMKPVWSPDGTSLAYLRMTENNFYELRVAHADGTGSRVLFASDQFGYEIRDLAWSPDSTLIAYISAYGAKNNLSVAHADGSDIANVVTSESALYDLSWQPLPSTSKIIWPTATPVLTPTSIPTQSPVVYGPNDFTASSGPGHTTAKLYSAPGEFVGDGQGSFTIEGKGELQTNGWWVFITLVEDDNPASWRFKFSAPYLHVGQTFTSETWFSTGGDELPAMSIEAPGRVCSNFLGEFTVEQVAPDVVISFKQYCDGDKALEFSGTLIFQPE